MKKKVFACILTVAMVAAMFSGCSKGKEAVQEEQKAPAATQAADEKKEETKQEQTKEQEVLTFYHAYYHDEATWPAAVAMRDIYQKFADQYTDSACRFEAVPVENVSELVTNEIAGGTFPNIVDFAGSEVPLAAIAQNLVYDMKSYVESEGLESKVGINYTMNQVDGKLYTIHDQLTTLGLWYNADMYKAANAATPDTWKTYDDMSMAMDALTAYGAANGSYAYSAGQGSIRLFNAYMGLLNKEYVATALTTDIINSTEFATVFKKVAAMDQANGSANTSDNVGDFSGDFTSNKCATWMNGVWGAGAFGDATADILPAVYPGSVSLSAPGGGLTIANGLSDAQTELALAFVKYMTSDEVQQRIFLEVNANPCNTDIALVDLAKNSNNATVELLAKACSMANEAGTIVNTINYVWGGDVQSAIINKLIESSVAGADIDAKLAELQAELIALIG